jgi:IS30 family transposase
MGNNYKHLTDEERDQIAVLKAAGKSVSHIARILCRHKSSISRELMRKSVFSLSLLPRDSSGQKGEAAQM